MKTSIFALCATLLTTAVAVRATAATALAEASSAAVAVDTTFTEGSAVTGAMQIKYGKVGGASGSRILANGAGVKSATDSGTFAWMPTACGNQTLELELVDSAGKVVASMSPSGVAFEGGHSGVVTIPAVEPTSTAAGHTAEITCSRCGTVMQQSTTIPALGYIRNVTARQLWPHKKVEVCYTLADDIGEVANESTTLTLTGKYGSTTKTASHKLGDTSYTPGLHHVVWDMEADGVAVNQSSMSFTVKYSSVSGTSPAIAVNTSSSVKDGMSVSGSMELGYSPISAGTAQLLVDGTVVLSSTNSGSFVWQPLTTGTHTLKHTAGSTTWTRTVNVTSVAFATPPSPNPPTAADANISIGQTARTFAQSGGSGTITTSGSGTWTASVSDSWITIPAALTSRNAGLPVAYTVAANTGVEARTGYIYVSGHVFTITQEGVGAALDSSSASFDMAGGSGSFSVLADAGISWNARPNVDWISIAPTSGTGDGEVSFTVAPYAEVSTRSGTITAAGCTFTVNQTGRLMKLDREAESCDYQSHVFALQLNALSGVEWGVWLDSPWLSVVDGGTGVGGSNLSLAIAENPSYLARTGVAMVGTETFTITQAGRPKAAMTFAVSPENSTASVNGANAIIAVTATPDLPWSASSGANWLTVMPSFGEGSGNGNVIYSASPNPTMAARTGTITVTPVAASQMAAKTHTVTQPAATATIAIAEHVFPAEGGSCEVSVTTGENVNWSVSENISWISFDGSSSRIGPGSVRVAATENLTVDAREATMSIAGHTFRAIQPGRTVEVEYENVVFDCYDNFATVDVHPDGNVSWVAHVSDPTWIIIWADDCDYDADGNVLGVGDATIQYMVTQYVGDGTPRTGWIEIGDKVVYITQRAFELSISPSSSTVSGNAGSGSVGVTASVGDVWAAIVTEPWITIVSGYDAGTGSGTVRYTFTDNNTGASRTGRIIIAGEEYTITQAARQLVRVDAEIQGVGGTVSGAGTYDRGTQVSLRAVAEDGCEFLGWTLPGGGTSAANQLAVTADVDKTIVARFRRIPLYDVNGEMVREGTVKTFTAPADQIDAAGTTKLVCIGTSAYPAFGRSFSLTVTGDISFEWDLWSTNYLLQAQTPANGKVKRNGSAFSQAWFAAGETATLTATPNSGYSFFRWTGDVEPAARGNATLALTLDAPKTVGAVFGVMTDTLAQAADAPALTFTTGGDAVWAPVIDATAESGYTSARSGAMGAESETWMETTVFGTGTLSFRWKADCEKDPGGCATWDRLTVFTNGVEAARLDGRTDWQAVTLPVGGTTTVRWSFYRDDFDEGNAGCANCGWIDGVIFEATPRAF